MPTVTLAGNSVTRAKVHLYAAGIPWVDKIALERAVTIAPGMVVPLVVAGLTITGSVYRGETYQGGASYRIEGGRGGWRQPVRAVTHQDDSGVRLSAVLAAVIADMPAAIRESLVNAPTSGAASGLASTAERRLGTTWLRPAGLASASLSLLAVPWFVLPSGETYAGARPTGQVVDPQAEVITYEPHLRRAVIATEKPEAWVPGLTFTSPRLASPILLREVTINVESGSLRVEVTG